MIVQDKDIGGATVRRVFTLGTQAVRNGETLTRDQVLAMPTNNRQSLIDNGYIVLHPLAPNPLHIISKGFGKYDIIQGQLLAEGLTKEQAEAFAPGSGPGDPAN